MKQIGAILIVLTLVTVFTAGGQSGDRQEQQDGAAEQELVQAEQQIAEAFLRGDSAVLDRLTADDFIGVNPLGQKLTKAQILARLHMPDYELDSFRHEDIEVRVFGDCAVVLARTVVQGRYQGRDAGGTFPYLRVWLRRQGRWQAVAAQSTSLPRPQPEAD